MKNIIAIKTLTNVSGLALYSVTDTEALIGFNDEKPEVVPVKHDDEGEPYIEYYGKQYLNEFTRTQ